VKVAEFGGLATARRFLPSPPELLPVFDIVPITEVAVSRIIKFAKAGGPDVLEFIEAPIPAPGPRDGEQRAVWADRRDRLS
jgi:hypothetical protein